MKKEESDNIKKVYILILFRALIILLSLIAIYIQKDIKISFKYFKSPADKFLIGLFFINIFYLLITRYINYKKIKYFISFQIIVDIFFQTILIYLTGGILSIFVSLYFGPIIAAGILIEPKMSIFIASASTISIAIIAFLYFYSTLNNTTLPFIFSKNIVPSLSEKDLPFCKAYLFAQGVAFHLVALLITRLSKIIYQERVLHEEILQNLEDGIILIDSSQKVLFLNNQAKNILDLNIDVEKKDYIGLPISKVLDHNNHKEILKLLIIEHKVSVDSYIIKKGEKIPIHLTISFFQTHQKINVYIVIIRDITEQKRMEEAIRRANKLETISEMTSVIAHEIRNPLASIKGAIQEIKNVISPSDERYFLINIAIKECERINNIITDFLKFSKVRKPVFQIIDISQLLKEFIVFFKARLNLDKAKIEEKIEDNLKIKGDKEQLKQVFYNLAINALEASKDNKLELTIYAKKKTLEEFEKIFKQNKNKNGIEIIFKDKGKGIPPENLNKIFKPFFTTKPHGTGMGMTLVSRILDLHNAFYKIESKLNEYTIFKMWFPISEEE